MVNKPLTIAMMIETVGMGGAEMVVYQLSEALRARGHTVHPVVPAGHEGWLLDRFRESRFEWQTYSHRTSIAPGLPGRMTRMFARLGIQAVHSHEFAMAVYGAAAARAAGVPHVITLHADQMMTARLRKRVALRWAFRRSHANVAVSMDTKRHLDAALGLKPDVIQVVLNGIPMRPGDANRVRVDLDVSDQELVLLAVGSLIERKGFHILIQALALLRETGDLNALRLYIAGQGTDRERLEHQAAEMGLADRVLFLGLRNDIPDLQAAADIFVMPSLWEGLPLALLEAMFAGNAIVATGISGIPEAVEHERHGLLVPPGDSVALAEALRRLVRDAALRRRLGKAALERARSQFTITAMANAYERLYRG